MAKVRVNGEYFEFDFSKMPLAEALALEEALKTTWGQWTADRQEGKARALAGLIWLIWRRNGREVDFADIESGQVEIDLNDFTVEDSEAEPDPTTSPSGKGASDSTGAATSGRSRKS